MNEKQLKAGLSQLASAGWSVVEFPDELLESLLGREFDAPAEAVKQRFLSKFRVRIQDAAIRKAHRTVGIDGVPFGRFIETIRETAMLTRSDIGSRLGKEEDFVQRVERGDVSPLLLSLAEVTDLVTLFQIRIKDAIQLVAAGLEFAHAKQEFKSGPALWRSESGQELGGERVEQDRNSNASRMRQKKAMRHSAEGEWIF
jgi:hypothetical protein